MIQAVIQNSKIVTQKKCGYKNSHFGIFLKSLPETTSGFDEAFNSRCLCWGGFLISLLNDRLFDLLLFILCFSLIYLAKRYSRKKEKDCTVVKSQHIFQ